MKTIILTCTALLALASSSLAASGEKFTNPDFTKGDAIPAKAKNDWNLGPTGLRGWMFFDKLVTTDARQIAITCMNQLFLPPSFCRPFVWLAERGKKNPARVFLP